MEHIIILPKGTIIHYKGFPCELKDDVKALSSGTLKELDKLGQEEVSGSKD